MHVDWVFLVKDHAVVEIRRKRKVAHSKITTSSQHTSIMEDIKRPKEKKTAMKSQKEKISQKNENADRNAKKKTFKIKTGNNTDAGM